MGTPGHLLKIMTLIIRDLIVSVEVDILYIPLVGYRNKQPNSLLDTLYVLTMNDEKLYLGFLYLEMNPPS